MAVTLQPCRQRRAPATRSHWPGWSKGRWNGGRGQAPERIAPPLFGIHATARALLPGSEGAESSPEQVGGLLERQVPHGLRLLRAREVLGP